uniref:Uncharacterized protein n=1 Tax=Solanum tuberosum TaxID=4113 RepID=M1DPQ9_SOLTU
MAPKARNVASGAGFTRNRNGEASGSSSSGEPFQKFGKKVVERYGHEWFDGQKRQNTLEMSTSMRTGPAFQEPLDDDEEDDGVNDDANALMVFDDGRADDDEA